MATAQTVPAPLRIYLLKVRDTGGVGVAWQLRYQLGKDQLYVGPEGDLVDPAGMARLDTEELAAQYRTAVLDGLRDAYGAGLDIAIEWTDTRERREADLLREHSGRVRRKLLARS